MLRRIGSSRDGLKGEPEAVTRIERHRYERRRVDAEVRGRGEEWKSKEERKDEKKCPF